MQTIAETDWHHQSDTQVLDTLGVTLDNGLDLREVSQRRVQFGPNTITQTR